MRQIESLEKLVNMFRTLPGVGVKTAQRYAYKVINSDMQYAEDFSSAVLAAKRKIRYCEECGNFTDSSICSICSKRKSEIICVVKEPKDVDAMERIKDFNGVYHVLHGTINPLENRGPNDIRLKELLNRINKHKTEEVIMATNPDVEGDVTAMYIAKILKPLGIKVTRIAQGISMGSELEYADEVTLTRAMEGRKEI